MKYSVIVPTVTGRDSVDTLMASLAGADSDRAEIVLINQSGRRIGERLHIGVAVREHLSDCRMAAAGARNLGGWLAQGEYLVFLDDDAQIASLNWQAELDRVTANHADCVVMQRGELRNGQYVSHWPAHARELNWRNFPRLAIEWNLAVRRECFLQVGGFPAIGTGTPHAAQSGEAFMLCARLLARGCRFGLAPNIRVAHPALSESPKAIAAALGYAYGAGYSVAASLNVMPGLWRLYWLLRGFSAILVDRYCRPEQQVIKLTESVSRERLRSSLARARATGLADGLCGRPPRGRECLERWSRRLAKDCQ